jgi:hypothetical protein
MKASRDGKDWQVGDDQTVSWIRSNTVGGGRITAAIPPIYPRYATLMPSAGTAPEVFERECVEALEGCTPSQPWWLGFLHTGAFPSPFPDAQEVELNYNWEYLFVRARPPQALNWRRGNIRSGLDGLIPEIIYPEDRSWLLSGMWDDAFICLGCDESVLNTLRNHEEISVDEVSVNETLVRLD